MFKVLTDLNENQNIQTKYNCVLVQCNRHTVNQCYLYCTDVIETYCGGEYKRLFKVSLDHHIIICILRSYHNTGIIEILTNVNTKTNGFNVIIKKTYTVTDQMFHI